jgi:hypothetical protein
MHAGNKNANIFNQTPQRKDHLEDLDVDGRIILKEDMKLWD